MERKWGKDSLKVYEELDWRLQRIVTRVRDEIGDISLLCGFRNETEQNEMHDAGLSEVRWPDGMHNRMPSLAVDFQPYPRPSRQIHLWSALSYYASAAIIIAREEGVTLRWGGDWNRNGIIQDQKFYDLFHIEIIHDAEIPISDSVRRSSLSVRSSV
jgi:hypothetical protein